jgi:homoserine dehydrogenase
MSPRSENRGKFMRGEYEKRPANAVVLKFGSSVLRDQSDLPLVATEIYRRRRDGKKVVAVVSAFAGETDALIAEAASLGGAKSRHAPRIIARGEERSAALLAIACENIGLDALVLDARTLSLTAGGPVDDAHPDTVDVDLLETALAGRDVIIVPGFVALGATGEPVLLGRGGSDLTAVFLASALRLGETTLMKDVDGVYDRDPNVDEGEALRYTDLDWAHAHEVAGKLLQPKAIDFAASHQVAIKVERLNAGAGTRVSAVSAPPAKAAGLAPMRVAVAGLGTIGEGAALRIAADTHDYRLSAALVRNAAKRRLDAFSAAVVADRVETLLATRPEAIVEALPDGAAGRALIIAALGNGVSIVTANKQAIAGEMAALTELAARNGAQFRYSPSVGGGAPLVETVAQAANAGRIAKIEAVLNGTVNFILTSLANGVAFAEAVRRAQIAGFAEPDPSADLSGADARAKLAILSFVAYGREVALDAIEIEALTAEKASAFAQAGGTVKQLATLQEKDGELTGSVKFMRVDEDPFFRGAQWEANALRAALEDGRVFETRGKGAGRKPTVESILADLGDLRRAKYSGALTERAFVR